jgi:tetratricopeptide (TPR) repeat protein
VIPGRSGAAAAAPGGLPPSRAPHRRSPRRVGPAAAVLLLGAAALAGCAGPAVRPPGTPDRVELAHVPFHAQREYECGPASLAMLLGAAGVEVSAEALVPQVYLPARQGTLQVELVAATRRYGRVPYVLRPEPTALYAELAAGRPAIVLQNLGSRGAPQWHYAVAIGYEPGRVLLRSGVDERLALRESRFLGTWFRGDAWALVALKPGELPADDDASRYLAAAAAFETAARPEDARAAFEAATRRWPGEPAAWLGLGNARLRAADVAGAEQAWRRALDVAPRHVAARNNLAELLARRGCVAAARTEIERALQYAAGTPLEAAVRATRDDIARMPGARAADACPDTAGTPDAPAAVGRPSR